MIIMGTALAIAGAIAEYRHLKNKRSKAGLAAQRTSIDEKYYRTNRGDIIPLPRPRVGR